MESLSEFIHFGTVAFVVAISAISVGIGQSLIAHDALEAMDLQPSARTDIMRTAILGISLTETISLIGVLISVILLWHTGNVVVYTNYSEYAELGILFAICIPSLVLGIVSSLPARAACFATARQPFFSKQITRFMLLMMSLLQAPIVLGFVISIFIRGYALSAETMRDSLRLIASGVCIGLGSVGSAMGLARFSAVACSGLGINRSSYRPIFLFTLVNQAIIETPLILSLIVSISLLFLVPSVLQENVSEGFTLFAAGLCTGLGSIGSGISSGFTASGACEQIAYNPETYGVLMRTCMFAQGIIQTPAIYAVLISSLLIFFR